MLNILWPIFIIISVVYAILTGRTVNVNNAIFSSVTDAVNLCIALLRYNVLMEWNYENCTNYNASRKNNKVANAYFKNIISRNTGKMKMYIMKYL